MLTQLSRSQYKVSSGIKSAKQQSKGGSGYDPKQTQERRHFLYKTCTCVLRRSFNDEMTLCDRWHGRGIRLFPRSRTEQRQTAVICRP